MRTGVFRHIRRNLIAYLALFFALTGTAGASIGIIMTKGDPAGGDLTGTYPNPLIANGKVTTAKIADGAITTSKFDSNATAPNASKLDGLDSSAFLSSSGPHVVGWADVEPDGSIRASKGVTSERRVGVGEYCVDFTEDAQAISVTVTDFSTDITSGFTSPVACGSPPNVSDTFVAIKDSVTGVPKDGPFMVVGFA